MMIENRPALRAVSLFVLLALGVAACSSSGVDSAGGDKNTADIDLTCDNAAFPSAIYTECEAQNYAKILEAPREQLANPQFQARVIDQTVLNAQSMLLRTTQDPSWLLAGNVTLDKLLAAALTTPASVGSALTQALKDTIADPAAAVAVSLPLNTPQTPLCASWGLPCAGDPFRYPDSNGLDGSAFYNGEAEVQSFVYYDDGCARIAGQVWAPKGSHAGSGLPAVVIENGSIEAPQTLYWYAAQLLVRNGYVVMTFDPRGQGRSDEQTPTGGQGGNINTKVFVTGLVNAIDFFRATPSVIYPWNAGCAHYYSTAVTDYNPFYDRIDRNRLGVAGHSAGAFGTSIVGGFDAPGTITWPGKMDASNPIKTIVAWDALSVGDGSAPVNEGNTAVPRVPAISLMSEYFSPAGASPTGLATSAGPYLTPPDPEGHNAAYQAFAAANVPVVAITIAGATHFDFSLLPDFSASSWCPSSAGGACSGGWGIGLIQHYTLAWFDRWLKNPGERGYEDADARLLDDDGPQGRVKMSWHFHSARKFPSRDGAVHECGNIRTGC